MTTLNKNFDTLINGMIESGKSFVDIRAAMLALDMVPNKDEAEKILLKKGVGKRARKTKTIVDHIYDWLATEPKTQNDFYLWLKKEHKESVWKKRREYDRVRELVNSIHENYGLEFIENLYIADQEQNTENK